MEAASIAWRPLGRLLVEQGLLTDEELELALAKQQLTGKRLGETIVECGFVSRPELSNALAAQYGIELKTETGFGTGLRAQIQQRHESDRGRVVHIGLALPVEPAAEEEPDGDLELVEPAENEPPQATDPSLLAQLEEQWAKLAAAEELLAERDAALAAAEVERDGRRAQAARLARLARTARGDQGSERARRRALIHRFMQRVREREDELRRVSAQLESHLDEQQAASTSAGEHRVELERELRLVAAQRDRRRAQAGRFLQRAQARDTELARCDEEVARLSQSLRAQVDEQRAALGAAAEREVALERALAGLASDFDRRHGQARRFARRALGLAEAVESLKSDVERVSADVHGCDAEIERLRRENARRRAQAARFAVRMRVRPSDPFVELVQVDEVDEPALPASHLIFVHTGGGYSLVERDGPPPARHTPLELPDLHDGPLVVSALRRSPLPGDARPCVVAERS